MQLTLYEYGPARARRVRWTLLELDMPFESISGRELFHSPELKKVQPLGKLPGSVADGRAGGHRDLVRRSETRKGSRPQTGDVGAGASRSVGLLCIDRTGGASVVEAAQHHAAAGGKAGCHDRAAE